MSKIQLNRLTREELNNLDSDISQSYEIESSDKEHSQKFSDFYQVFERKATIHKKHKS